MTAAKVEVDPDRCMGTGGCVFIAPDVFDMADGGIAVVVGPVDSGDERVLNAIAECPMYALTLHED